MDSVSFHQYICSLDFNRLPRVVKICSGVYFEGSVYEIFGDECCLSTGDLLKIVAIQLQKVTCKNVENGHTFELPLDFNGLFQPSPEPHHRERKKNFSCSSLFSKDKSIISYQPQLYTLQEVLQSVSIQQKKLKCAELSQDELYVFPVYEVKAIMHFRNSVVKVKSTLDVEVVDITDESQDIHFIKPLMLSEVLVMEDVLPVEAEILEPMWSLPVFRSDWVFYLQKGCRIHLHSKESSWKILASSRKGKSQACHFLISSRYKGSFRRCPRKFSSTSELALSLTTDKKLHVVVTKDYENSEEEFPLFSIGDRLEVLDLAKSGDLSATDMLICCKDHGDEDKEQIKVPLFLDACFVEDIHDRRKYTLTELLEHYQLPCEVKVVAHDCTSDHLASFSVLTLEAQIKEPFFTVSLVKEPALTFEIVPKWLDMSLFFTSGPVRPTSPKNNPTVEEITEAFYYYLQKMMPSKTPAPPRPPKKGESRIQKGPRPTNERENKATASNKMPPRNSNSLSQESARPLFSRPKETDLDKYIVNNPNEYTTEYQTQRSQKPTKPYNPRPDMINSSLSSFKENATFSGNSDHEYEEIDKDAQEISKKMERAAVIH
uniref:Thymocyte selection associated family member 2 n=1 Tax=Salvator merianae TaxID=96440 RepID=A0A8D0BD38_SALMN